MGNYRGFGDSKIIPGFPKEKLEKLIMASDLFKKKENETKFLWENVKEKMFSLENKEMCLGLNPKVRHLLLN
jgi:dipeptidyl-peptidase-3